MDTVISPLRIVNDAVNKNAFQFIEKHVFSEQFSWMIRKTTQGGRVSYSENCVDGFSFFHLAFADEKRYSEISTVLEMALYECTAKLEQPVKQIHRIIIGCLTHKNSVVKNNIHIDMQSPHKVGLLYLNDCDGDTDIFKTTFNPGDFTHSDGIIDLPDSDIEESITPEKNKFVTFSGKKFHRSTHPTNTFRRLVVNYDYS
jgi:hypothetical protein